MKKHIAMVSVPAHGHINPTLPLVDELTRRGHRVSYATGESMLETVEAAGAAPVRMPSQMPDVSLVQNRAMSIETLLSMMSFMRDQVTDAFPVLQEHFRADPPEVICTDMMSVVGRMLADKLGTRDVALLPSFAANEHFDLHDRMAQHVDFTDPRMQQSQQEFAALGERFGVRTELMSMRSEPAPVNLVFLPNRLQPAAETFDERYHFIGPCLGRRAEQDYHPADEQAPLLFVSLGTAFNHRPDFYRLCLEAFADSRWQVAMSIGGTVDVSELGTIPGNIDIRPSFPQPGVLRRASAFITHNGMGSTMEALYYGVPQLGLPQMPEQEANADRVAELGLGKRLDENQLDADRLRAAVEQIAADEQVRDNLAEMREHVRGAGGPIAGADIIENQAA
ncbi:macrolide family glycosyltransferase [Saccharopolyspora sp. SCSIO 74807]|uniref:macrolide family glycosyltransferase n=1 Tax=Saccharopolyspora sp. SCSIO 74807 TaxID=3118084 RepID=UPI0030D05DA7